MVLKGIENKGPYYEIEVYLDLLISGKTHIVTFIATRDVELSSKMCDACPLYQDCFEKDTLKYELCCFLELRYPTIISDMGVVYMKPESAREIKKIIDGKLGYDEDELEEEDITDDPNNIDEEPKQPKSQEESEPEPTKPLMNWETINRGFEFL